MNPAVHHVGLMPGGRAVAGLDPVAVMRRRFPGLVFWRGRYTGHWWALVYVASGWRLIEALDIEDLTKAMREAETWPWPRELVRRVDGSAGVHGSVSVTGNLMRP